MPCLEITKNGQHLCTVGSDDVWMFSVSLWSDLWSPAISTLDISGGGKRRADGSADILVWKIPHAVSPGDRIGFTFGPSTASLPKGEIFKSEPAPIEEDEGRELLPPSETELRQLESRPVKNAGLFWHFSLNGKPPIKVGPNPVRPHVGLLLLWNEDSAQRMRVSLSRSSLSEIATRSGGESTVLEYVPSGSRVEVLIGA